MDKNRRCSELWLLGCCHHLPYVTFFRVPWGQERSYSSLYVPVTTNYMGRDAHSVSAELMNIQHEYMAHLQEFVINTEN